MNYRIVSSNHNDVSFLKERFLNIFKRFDNSSEIEAFFNEVKKHYEAPSRHHHNLNHILEILRYIDERKDLINNWEAVQLAIFLHDVIYDVENTEPWKNERDSIGFSKQWLYNLWVENDIIHRVSLHIWDTISHTPSVELWSDWEYFLDWDLSVLWASQERYDKYKSAIKAEYSWVPDEIYSTQRAKVMSWFLDREKIFFRNQALEVLARDNIQSEISNL